MEASATVVPAIAAAAGVMSGYIPVVAGIGIGIGLLGFGISYLVRTFRRSAR